MPDNRKVRLVYKDFRPLRKGEPGYSSTKRRLVSPSTGEILNRRQFTNLASKQEIPRKSTKNSSTNTKPRKPRADKGMTRKDYKLVKEHLDYQKRPEEPANPSYLWKNINSVPSGSGTVSNTTYTWLMSGYRRKVEKETGEKLTDVQIARAPDFQLVVQMWSTKDRKAHGNRARVLEEFDIREPDADYDVGDTP